ncbi:hypothetical protein [Novosphingobium sp. KN65.2]|uniref:hypothetical protein n=1 Tax=Novosphingobium sp. KN65.2 TaxID=1478134 RepID=UPI0012E23F92|nr:hypothetical protein [Novosphingobium sp. KN65.2]
MKAVSGGDGTGSMPSERRQASRDALTGISEVETLASRGQDGISGRGVYFKLWIEFSSNLKYANAYNDSP